MSLSCMLSAPKILDTSKYNLPWITYILYIESTLLGVPCLKAIFLITDIDGHTLELAERVITEIIE